jgi:hypothetical protein
MRSKKNYILMLLPIFLFLVGIVEAQSSESTDINLPGFMKLKWEMTVDEIIEVYGDNLVKLHSPKKFTVPNYGGYFGNNYAEYVGLTDDSFEAWSEYVWPNYSIANANFTVYFQVNEQTKVLQAIRIQFEKSEERESRLFDEIAHDFVILYGEPSAVAGSYLQDTKIEYKGEKWESPSTLTILTYDSQAQYTDLRIDYISVKALDEVKSDPIPSIKDIWNILGK